MNFNRTIVVWVTQVYLFYSTHIGVEIMHINKETEERENEREIEEKQKM